MIIYCNNYIKQNENISLYYDMVLNDYNASGMLNFAFKPKDLLISLQSKVNMLFCSNLKFYLDKNGLFSNNAVSYTILQGVKSKYNISKTIEFLQHNWLTISKYAYSIKQYYDNQPPLIKIQQPIDFNLHIIKNNNYLNISMNNQYNNKISDQQNSSINQLVSDNYITNTMMELIKQINTTNNEIKPYNLNKRLDYIFGYVVKELLHIILDQIDIAISNTIQSIDINLKANNNMINFDVMFTTIDNKTFMIQCKLSENTLFIQYNDYFQLTISTNQILNNK